MIIDPAKLEELLRPIAKALGLRVKVTYNDAKSVSPYSYCLDMALVPPPREVLTIDEEMFVGLASGVREVGGHVVDLLMRELNGAQLVLHKRTREQMDKLDRRGAVAALSREDKNALHELLWLAGKACAMSGPQADHDRKVYEASRKLVDKLFA